MNINDLKYWNFYYNKENKLVKKSNFAALIKKKLLKKRMNILEIGTGNGRDAFYFSKHSNVLAIDQSSSAINENKLKAKELNINNLKFKKLNVDKILQIKNRNKINLIYARFFIHSINLNRENKLLNEYSIAYAEIQNKVDLNQATFITEENKDAKKAYKKALDELEDLQDMYENKSEGMLVNHFIKASQRYNESNPFDNMEEYLASTNENLGGSLTLVGA